VKTFFALRRGRFWSSSQRTPLMTETPGKKTFVPKKTDSHI
jgi:hypothetical protein